MKSLSKLFISVLFILPFAAYTQNSGIDAALNKGNAADLGVFFTDKVDVSILDNDSSVPSSQAVQRLSDFFSQNVVKTYKRTHLTSPADGRASYSLGDLSTSTGSYRIYLYYDTKQKISEIRIEK
jgi:hypothetical protein